MDMNISALSRPESCRRYGRPGPGQRHGQYDDHRQRSEIGRQSDPYPGRNAGQPARHQGITRQRFLFLLKIYILLDKNKRCHIFFDTICLNILLELPS